MIDAGRRAFLATSGASLVGLSILPAWYRDQRIDDLGGRVPAGRLQDVRVGPDASGARRRVYLAFSQAQGMPPFLLAVDPETGAAAQYPAPQGRDVEGFKSLHASHDGCVYVGGYKPARLFRFDPRAPQAGLVDLGMLGAAGMVWSIVDGADGAIYASTSDPAELFVLRDGRIARMGALSDENAYATVLLPSEDGRALYAVVGPRAFDVVEYDLTTGARRGLLPAIERGVGFLGIHALGDGRLAIERPDGRVVPTDRRVRPAAPARLADGAFVRATDERISVEREGVTRELALRYDATAWLYRLHTSADGEVFGFTHGPLRMVRHAAGMAPRLLPNPVATSDGYSGAVANWGSKIAIAAYPGGDLAIYDPALPWSKGSTPGSNPWTLGKVEGTGHTRPQAMVAGRDDLLYLASDAAYGLEGGALAAIDPRSGRTLYNVRDQFATLSPVSLAADPDDDVVYVGCQGSGAGVMAWDTATRQVRWISQPVRGARAVPALICAGGKLHGAAYHDYESQTCFVLNRVTGRVERTTPAGRAVIQGNFLEARDGSFVGLSYVRPTLFRIDARGRYSVLARLHGAQGYGLALAGDAAYFSDGITMKRIHIGN